MSRTSDGSQGSGAIVVETGAGETSGNLKLQTGDASRSAGDIVLQVGLSSINGGNLLMQAGHDCFAGYG